MKLLKRYYIFFRRVAFEIMDIFFYFLYRKRTILLKEKREAIALVLGNGPSLEAFLKNKQFFFGNYDLYVCNGFARTFFYEMLKPKNYSILDPVYFDLKDDRVVSKLIDVEEVWELIFKKTNWPLTIYTSLFPGDIKKIDEIINRFGENKWLTWVNLCPIKFYGSKKNHFYSKCIGLIGGITVIHLSLQIAILNKHKEIYLAGVDHDWIENINYDADTHKVYLLNKHFFDETRLYYGEGVLKDIDLSVEFANIGKSFQGFMQLLDFAKYKGVNVYRCTKSFLYFIPFKKIEKTEVYNRG
jgi:hypothetical protein